MREREIEREKSSQTSTEIDKMSVVGVPDLLCCAFGSECKNLKGGKSVALLHAPMRLRGSDVAGCAHSVCALCAAFLAATCPACGAPVDAGEMRSGSKTKGNRKKSFSFFSFPLNLSLYLSIFIS